MRIAMIGQKGLPAKFGGVEKHVADLSLHLSKLGFDVTVYGRKWYTDADSILVHGVFSKIVPSLHTKHLDTISHTFLATLDAMLGNYDVIHYHGVGPSLLSWIPRLFTPHIKVVTTFHSIDRKHAKWNLFARMILRLGERAACTFAHETIAVSRTIQQYARDVYDCDTNYVPNCVYSLKKTQKTSVIKKWGLHRGEYILIVSRLIPHKGVHYVISAFTQLQKKYPKLLGNKKLVIVGDGYYTQDYVNYLKDMAEENSKIVFTGFQNGEALEQLFSNAEILVHPSDQEGMPITILEAMSYGLPVVSSDIPEHRELIVDESFLFKHGNVRSLMQTLRSVLGMKKADLEAHAKNGKQTIETHFSWEQIVPEIVAIYKEPIPQPLPETRIMPAIK